MSQSIERVDKKALEPEGSNAFSYGLTREGKRLVF